VSGSGSVVGLGVDVVDVDRFALAVSRRPSLLTRVFTPAELDGAGARDGVVTARGATRLAARFAAKEAVMKALGVGLGAFAFTEVEVRTAPGGAPSLVMTGGADRCASDRAVAVWQLSLSHTATTAVAVALALS